MQIEENVKANNENKHTHNRLNLLRYICSLTIILHQLYDLQKRVSGKTKTNNVKYHAFILHQKICSMYQKYVVKGRK